MLNCSDFSPLLRSKSLPERKRREKLLIKVGKSKRVFTTSSVPFKKSLKSLSVSFDQVLTVRAPLCTMMPRLVLFTPFFTTANIVE